MARRQPKVIGKVIGARRGDNLSIPPTAESYRSTRSPDNLDNLDNLSRKDKPFQGVTGGKKVIAKVIGADAAITNGRSDDRKLSGYRSYRPPDNHADNLRDIAYRVRALIPLHYDPEAFHEQKSSIEHDLRMLARELEVTDG